MSVPNRFRGDFIGNWSLSAAYNHDRNAIDRRINALVPLAQIANLKRLSGQWR